MPPETNSSNHLGFRDVYRSFKRTESLELLNPPSDSPLRKTSSFFGTFNLVATIVGGGVLSLPLAFAKVGIVLGTAMMIFSAVITDFSLYILCCCARRTGSATYMDVVRFAFGPMAEICTTAILWIFLSGVLVAFNVLIRGIFAPLARDFVSTFTSIDVDSTGVVMRQFDSLVLLCILLLASPMMLKRNLHALRHICYVGFTSVCLVGISIGIRAFQRNQSAGRQEGMDSFNIISNDMRIKYFTTDWMDVLFAFPIFVLSFMCSFNIVEVHGALENPTRKRVKSVIHTAVASCCVLYQAIGSAGYFYAYNACRGNILLNFDPSDSLIIVGRLGMGLTITFGIPVLLLPCRVAFLSLIPQIQKWWSESREIDKLVQPSEADALITNAAPLLEGTNLDSYSSFSADRSEAGIDVEQNHTVPVEEDLQDRNAFVHVGTTIVIASYAFFGAVSVPGVAIVWSVLGSSLGMLVGFIIPCACYLKIRGTKGMKRRTNFGALALLVFSIVIAVVCTGQTIWGLL